MAVRGRFCADKFGTQRSGFDFFCVFLIPRNHVWGSLRPKTAHSLDALDPGPLWGFGGVKATYGWN